LKLPSLATGTIIGIKKINFVAVRCATQIHSAAINSAHHLDIVVVWNVGGELHELPPLATGTIIGLIKINFGAVWCATQIHSVGAISTADFDIVDISISSYQRYIPLLATGTIIGIPKINFGAVWCAAQERPVCGQSAKDLNVSIVACNSAHKFPLDWHAFS
jgi:hypothetical protein